MLLVWAWDTLLTDCLYTLLSLLFNLGYIHLNKYSVCPGILQWMMAREWRQNSVRAPSQLQRTDHDTDRLPLMQTSWSRSANIGRSAHTSQIWDTDTQRETDTVAWCALTIWPRAAHILLWAVNWVWRSLETQIFFHILFTVFHTSPDLENFKLYIDSKFQIPKPPWLHVFSFIFPACCIIVVLLYFAQCVFSSLAQCFNAKSGHGLWLWCWFRSAICCLIW